MGYSVGGHVGDGVGSDNVGTVGSGDGIKVGEDVGDDEGCL